MSNGRRRRGFTLVELLVVMGIIAVLIGILLPVMNKVKIAANRTACGAQLRDIGSIFQMYLTANKNRLPYLNPLPGRLDASGKPYGYYKKDNQDAALLWDVFEPYSKLGLTPQNFRQSRKNVWMCPGDKLLTRVENDFEKDSPGETYYENFGTSYEYNFWMNELYGKESVRNLISTTALQPPNSTLRSALGEANTERTLPDGSKRKGTPASEFRIFNDFSYFHGKKGTFGNMNFLFADWHVSDLAGSTGARSGGAGR